MPNKLVGGALIATGVGFLIAAGAIFLFTEDLNIFFWVSLILGIASLVIGVIVYIYAMMQMKKKKPVKGAENSKATSKSADGKTGVDKTQKTGQQPVQQSSRSQQQGQQQGQQSSGAQQQIPSSQASQMYQNPQMMSSSNTPIQYYKPTPKETLETSKTTLYPGYQKSVTPSKNQSVPVPQNVDSSLQPMSYMTT